MNRGNQAQSASPSRGHCPLHCMMMGLSPFFSSGVRQARGFCASAETGSQDRPRERYCTTVPYHSQDTSSRFSLLDHEVTRARREITTPPYPSTDIDSRSSSDDLRASRPILHRFSHIRCHLAVWLVKDQMTPPYFLRLARSKQPDIKNIYDGVAWRA